jgi:hypothetical protein
MGISTDWSFEEQARDLNPKLRIEGYDHTISGYIFKRKIFSAMLRFFLRKSTWAEVRRKAGISKAYGQFFGSQSAVHHKEMVCGTRSSQGCANVDKIFGRVVSGKVFLKIDIEGSEYEIIDALMLHAHRVTGLAMEFHETDSKRAIFVNAVKTLQRAFDIVHLHANNYGGVGPDGLPVSLELSFTRKNTAQPQRFRNNLPLPLIDTPNNPELPDYVMHFATPAA